MERAKKDYIGQWFHKADEDIAVLKKLISDEPEHYTGAICFHAQQADEPDKRNTKLRGSYFPYGNKSWQSRSVCSHKGAGRHAPRAGIEIVAAGFECVDKGAIETTRAGF